VNPREWLFTPGDDDGYHDTPVLDGEVDKLYQEEKLLALFVVEPGPELDGVEYKIVMLMNSETNYM
jgi:hypothetical protein